MALRKTKFKIDVEVQEKPRDIHGDEVWEAVASLTDNNGQPIAHGYEPKFSNTPGRATVQAVFALAIGLALQIEEWGFTDEDWDEEARERAPDAPSG